MIGQMVPGSRLAVAARFIPVVPLATMVLVVAAMFRPRADSAFAPIGIVCMRNGMTYSIPAFLLFGAIGRCGAMLNPKVMGAAAGSLAGFAGLAALEMNCPNPNVFHRIVWHCGVVLISSAIGTLFGVAAEQVKLRRRPQVS
jgi:hypothetical protein